MLTSIVVGLLVDNEMLDYRERIARVWPEYGAGGKEEGTVADLMRHELGLPMLSSSLQPRDFSREQIRQPENFNAVGFYLHLSFIQEQLPRCKGGE